MQSIEAKNMIQHQVHTWEILDESLLLLMDQIDRQHFVHPDYHGVAYSEGAIKAVNGTLMLPAKEVGRMLTTLSIAQTDNVAVVGAESGYAVALMAQLSQHVTWFLPKTVDVLTPEIKGVTRMNKDLLNEWQQDGPFDVIVVMGGMLSVPPSFLTSLRSAGRLWVVLAENATLMTATLFVRGGQQEVMSKRLFETKWPLLSGAHLTPDFLL